MFLDLFYRLRAAGIPATPSDHLDLLKAVQAGLGQFDLNTLFHLARLTLVKDEQQYDRFAHVFDACLADARRSAGRIDRTVMATHIAEAIATLGGDPPWGQDDGPADPEAAAEAFTHALAGPIMPVPVAPAPPPVPASIQTLKASRVQDRPMPAPGVRPGWADRHYAGVDRHGPITPAALHLALRRLRGFAQAVCTPEVDVPETVTRFAIEAGPTEVAHVRGRRPPVRLIVLMAASHGVCAVCAVWQSLIKAFRGEFRDVHRFHIETAAPGDAVALSALDGATIRDPLSVSSLIARFPFDYRVLGLGAVPSDAAAIHNLAGWFFRVAWLSPDVQAHGRLQIDGRGLPATHGPMTLDGLDHAISALH